MGNCQGRSAPIEKDLESEDNHSTLDKVKNKKVQAIKSKSSADQEESQQQALENAPEFFKLRKQETQEVEQNEEEAQQTQELKEQQIDDCTMKELIQLSEAQEENYRKFHETAEALQDDWLDTDFPAEFKSLTQYPEKYSKGKQYQWLRAHQIQGFEQAQNVFEGGVAPQDIKQGALGDCYLLSSLAALAENSEQHLISRLFEIKIVKENNIFGVWLCIMGEWQLVWLDDYFPCNQSGTPAYSKANGNELWVLLIEKAYAKVYGSYKKIEAGLTGNALRDLTGSPYIFYNNQDVDETWTLIDKYDNNENILTAGSQSDSRGTEQKLDTGIISGHAYSILAHAEVTDSQGEKCRIVQLRNPWGSHEWTGRFSDNSDSWTEELKKELNVTAANDGIFWMPIEDYCQGYAETTINFLKKDYFYTSLKVETGGQRQFLINFTVDQKMKGGYISIAQKSDRWFEDGDGNTEYYYSMVRLVVMQKTEYGYKCVGEQFKSERDIDCYVKMRPGEYVALVEVDWIQDYSNDFVISAYSEKKLQFGEVEELTNTSYLSYIDAAIRDKDLEKSDIVHTYREGETLFRIRSEIAGFIYFLYINSTSSLELSESADMLNVKNMEVCEPFEDTSTFDVSVRPGEKVIVKFRIDEKAWGAYGFSTKYRSGLGSVAYMC